MKIAPALAVLLASAASGAVFSFEPAPVRSLLEARHQNVVVQQWDSSCGAAALATILHYQLGEPVDERAVALGMLRRGDPDRVRSRGGFSLLDMKRYAVQRGFAADGYVSLTRGQLIRLAPAIVPIRSNGGDHFVVFRGVVGGEAILADPAFGNRSIPFEAFASQWKDGIGFVVVRAAERTRANRLFPTRRDVLRVEDEAARRAMEETLPKPLNDLQLAAAFASERSLSAGPEEAGLPALATATRAASRASGTPVSSTSDAPTAAPISTGTSVAAPATPLGTTTSTVGPATSTISGTTGMLAPATSTLTSTTPAILPSVTGAVGTVTSVIPSASIPLGR
jgi:predicted double-glycine peptidase